MHGSGGAVLGVQNLIAMDYRRWGTALVWNCARLIESMTAEIHTWRSLLFFIEAWDPLLGLSTA